MGFNKCYLQSLDEMKKIVEENGVEYFLNLYKKCDCIIGSSESIKFLNKIIKDNPRAPEPGKFGTHLPGQEIKGP